MDIKTLPLEVQAVIYRAVNLAVYPPKVPAKNVFRTLVRWQDIVLLRDELALLGIDIAVYLEEK